MTLRGRGSGLYNNPAAKVQTTVLSYTTELHDTSTGITVLTDKVPSAIELGQTALKWRIERMALTGNANNVYGLFGANNWFLLCDDVDFASHGIAGACLELNTNLCNFSNCRFMNNGSARATTVTAGLPLASPNSQPAAPQTIQNCLFSNNYGFHVVRAQQPVEGLQQAESVGVVFTGCGFNFCQKSELTYSGIGATVNSGFSGSRPLSHAGSSPVPAPRIFRPAGPQA